VIDGTGSVCRYSKLGSGSICISGRGFAGIGGVSGLMSSMASGAASCSCNRKIGAVLSTLASQRVI
jgi:hypothetical protein